MQNTPVKDVAFRDESVTITTAKGKIYQADFIVDAGGFRSLIAQKFDLRDFDLQTQTRGMYTHMVDVPCFHDVSFSREENGVPFRWSEGTLHHLFEGGWLWVIPFNNHPEATNPVVSVGLLLDPRVHVPRTDLSPEDEFNAFIGQYPGLKKQFKNAKPIRGWVRAERLQYSSKHVVGDRFALLGHAAGFIDPLYSKGLYVTHMTVMLLADLLIKAKKTGDYSAKAFAPLEEITLGYIQMHDRLTMNSIKSWSNYKLWRVYSVQWLLGAYLEYLMLSITRMRAKDRGEYIALLKDNCLAGGGFSDFFDLQQKVDALFDAVDPHDEADVDRMVAEANALFRNFKWLPLPFNAILEGANHLPKNKFRLTLFNKEDGFMGSGAYRRHFFGNLSLLDLGIKAAQEKFFYARAYLRWQRKKDARLSWK